MLSWMLFAPAMLAAAARLGTTPSTVDHAYSRELLSLQEVTAVVSSTATIAETAAREVCFEVQKARSYWSVGTTSGKLQGGDYECVHLVDKGDSTQNALAGLADGDLVRLRRSYFWAVRVVERNGFRMKESTLECPVTVLQVGAEVSRQVQMIQRVTANYEGSTKSEGAHMVVGTGVDSSSAELACFMVYSQMNAIGVPASDKVEGMLYKNEQFCIRLDDQNSATLATIRTLVVGELVTMVLASEVVEYEWRNGAGATEGGAEWDFKFDLRKGMQMNELISLEQATLTFEGAEAVSASDGDYAMRFCFKAVETEAANDRIVCFLNNLQLVATQVKLLGFTRGQQVRLGWRKCKVSFTGGATYTQTTATEENLITSIGMWGSN